MIEAQQLILVRQFVAEADRQLERVNDFGNGLAVSLMQDAVELTLRIVVRERQIDIEPRAGLDQLINAINKAALDDTMRVPQRARLEDLNKGRVAFKHSGAGLDRATTLRLVQFGRDFLQTAFPQFFAVEYDDFSLIELIKSAEVRGLLKEAEKKLASEAYKDALIEAADAVRVSQSMLELLMPPASNSGFGHEQHDAWLVNYLNGLRLISLAALVRFDVRELLRFRALAPNVSKSASGQRHVTFLGPANCTAEHAAFGVRFARDFALGVQTLSNVDL